MHPDLQHFHPKAVTGAALAQIHPVNRNSAIVGLQKLKPQHIEYVALNVLSP
jgi:hypothetical protein